MLEQKFPTLLTPHDYDN